MFQTRSFYRIKLSQNQFQDNILKNTSETLPGKNNCDRILIQKATSHGQKVSHKRQILLLVSLKFIQTLT